jgi:hypothetical protein
MVTKRGNSFCIYFKPFKDKLIGVRVEAMTKREAEHIEGAVLRACRTGNYIGLDPVSRETCVRMYANRRWVLPPELGGHVVEVRPTEELTLWKACQLFLNYPEIKKSRSRERYEFAVTHLAEKLGTGRALKSIWVPDLKQYQIERTNEGAAADTVNKELSTLSRIFGVMIELQLVETNPVRLLKRLSTKSGERQVHLSLGTSRRL